MLLLFPYLLYGFGGHLERFQGVLVPSLSLYISFDKVGEFNPHAERIH